MGDSFKCKTCDTSDCVAPMKLPLIKKKVQYVKQMVKLTGFSAATFKGAAKTAVVKSLAKVYGVAVDKLVVKIKGPAKGSYSSYSSAKGARRRLAAGIDLEV